MYRQLFASLLLLASSTALVDTKPGRPKAMRMPAMAAKTSNVRMPAKQIQKVKLSQEISNSCCPDFPYCGCPKLEIDVESLINNSCCPDFPYCGCPKLETLYQIDLDALERQISNSCCPDFPYCGCPKLEADSLTANPRFGSYKKVSERRARVMALRAIRQ